jgi:predicted molibdopterin-dependent oxidoreductase YjgC
MALTGIKITINIDGKDFVCDPGETVLDVAKRNNIDIPTFCYNPLLFEYQRLGSCRLCLVEVISGGKPGLQSSCTLPVSTGLTVSTNSEMVYQARRSVVELLLSEHVMDCCNCGVSGNCIFAKMCRDYDINGVTVCAECPNQKEGCLLQRSTLCLGPITYAGCNAYCTRKGYRCEGCFSMVQNEDILRFGLKAYRDGGFSADEILNAARIFSFDRIALLEKVMKEEGFE